jgi:hypothetical protein
MEVESGIKKMFRMQILSAYFIQISLQGNGIDMRL